MRASAFFNQLQQQIDEVKAEGLYKSERVITSQQQAQIEVASGDKVINFCANNYLGLANSPELIKAAQQGHRRSMLLQREDCADYFWFRHTRHHIRRVLPVPGLLP